MAYREAPPAAPTTEIAVATYDAPHEAHLAILHLETLGISGRTLNELVVGMAPHLGGGLGGIQVLVAEEDAAEAHRALETLRRQVAQERSQRSQQLLESPTERRPHKRLAVGLVGLGMLVWYLLNQLR